MSLLTFAIAAIGYFIANASRHYLKCQRTALLSPPVNLFEDDEDTKADKEGKNKEIRTKYSKAQVKQRFRKGKV